MEDAPGLDARAFKRGDRGGHQREPVGGCAGVGGGAGVRPHPRPRPVPANSSTPPWMCSKLRSTGWAPSRTRMKGWPRLSAGLRTGRGLRSDGGQPCWPHWPRSPLPECPGHGPRWTFPTRWSSWSWRCSPSLSWVIIFWKLRQFRALRPRVMPSWSRWNGAQRLEDAYKGDPLPAGVPLQPVFRQGGELLSRNSARRIRSGRGSGWARTLPSRSSRRSGWCWRRGSRRSGMSSPAGSPGSPSWAPSPPYLGLLGTVIGVMNAFLGIAATGSTNIGAVAPGWRRPSLPRWWGSSWPSLR